MEAKYLIGYGSLINKTSLENTHGKVDTLVPVEVKGIERKWNAQAPTLSMTFLGTIPNEEASMSGVLFEVNDQGLVELDKREAPNSIRTKVENDKVEILDTRFNLTTNDEVYVYFTNPDYRKEATEEFPIPQTYVDTVLAGALEFGEDFARRFIETTKGWKPWIDDTQNPRYTPPYFVEISDETMIKINELLKEVIPNEFSRRKTDTN